MENNEPLGDEIPLKEEKDKESKEKEELLLSKEQSEKKLQLEEEEEEVDEEEGEGEGGLRQRKKKHLSPTEEEESVITTPETKEHDSSYFGITPDGTRFRVPKTSDPFPFVEGSNTTLGDPVFLVKLIPMCLNLTLLFLPLPYWFYIAWFILWRAAYNGGLGYVLYKQSQGQSVVKCWKSFTQPEATFYGVLRELVSKGMGPEYKYHKVPMEYNAWLAFRLFTDCVLGNDFWAYFIFCMKFWNTPDEFTLTHLVMYIVGTILVFFALWAKRDAYRVVEDYAWYWGDFFFLIERQLTFDRVFSLFPHPMYTLGYSFYYGAALITQSSVVLYMSLIAHVCQLLFLELVETPHIRKIYPEAVEDNTIKFQKAQSYFRKDLIVFRNFNPLRFSDLALLVVFLQTSFTLLLGLPPYFYIGQALLWRFVHSFGLGYVLYKQSNDNTWISTYFRKGFTKEASFRNWKRIYNLSLTMTWTSFIVMSVALAEWPSEMVMDINNSFWFRQTLGLILIALNVWSSMSTFNVLGSFGWFFGDFFLTDEVPSKLYYTGIYRFLNNPEVVTGFAAHYGMACITGSWVVFFLALVCHGCNYLFINMVEKPHIKRLYGEQVRPSSGSVSAAQDIVKKVVDRPTLKQLGDMIKSWTNKGQYEETSIMRYEKVFGYGFMSTGGPTLTRKFAEYVDFSAENTRVLDIGYGLGGAAQLFSREYGAEVLGIERSETAFNIAMSRGLPKGVRIKLGQLNDPKMDILEGEDKFNIVWARDVMLHVANKSRYLKRFHKVLAPGGQVMVTDYLKGDTLESEKYSEEFTSYVSESDYHLEHLEEYKSLFDKAGFHLDVVLDKTNLFLRLILEERRSLVAGKDEFLHNGDLEESDWTYLLNRWEQKKRLIESGELKYGLFVAQKKE